MKKQDGSRKEKVTYEEVVLQVGNLSKKKKVGKLNKIKSKSMSNFQFLLL